MTTTTASRRRESTAGHTARLIARILVVVLPAIYALVSLNPFLTMLSGAVQTHREVRTHPLPIPFAPTLQTLADTFAALDFGSLWLNSVLIAGGTCLVVLVIFPLAGYAFEVLKFPFQRTLFGIFVGGLFVRGVTVLLPLVVLDQNLGITGTPFAVIFPLANAAAPIAIVLLRSYFSKIPGELHEAAVLDGCSELGIYWRVYFPLSRSALITVTILNFVAAWNEYVLPSLTNDDATRFPLPVGLQSLLSTSVVQWNQVMAAALIIVILLIIVQRYFINGLAGSVKG